MKALLDEIAAEIKNEFDYPIEMNETLELQRPSFFIGCSNSVEKDNNKWSLREKVKVVIVYYGPYVTDTLRDKANQYETMDKLKSIFSKSYLEVSDDMYHITKRTVFNRAGRDICLRLKLEGIKDRENLGQEALMNSDLMQDVYVNIKNIEEAD